MRVPSENRSASVETVSAACCSSKLQEVERLFTEAAVGPERLGHGRRWSSILFPCARRVWRRNNTHSARRLLLEFGTRSRNRAGRCRSGIFPPSWFGFPVGESEAGVAVEGCPPGGVGDGGEGVELAAGETDGADAAGGAVESDRGLCRMRKRATFRFQSMPEAVTIPAPMPPINPPPSFGRRGSQLPCPPLSASPATIVRSAARSSARREFCFRARRFAMLQDRRDHREIHAHFRSACSGLSPGNATRGSRRPAATSGLSRLGRTGSS